MDTKTRVLIVDDDERNVRILYEILEDDFELYSASNGEDAITEVGKVSPDIILLDIMMPGIDGYEVCKQLKQSGEHQNIKIILVSGKALTEERIKGYEVGADDFVVKPFDMDEIHAKVKVFAKLKSMEEVNKLKTDFLNLINHETGTPLNHIIGTSDLLLMKEDLDSEVTGSVRDINQAAHCLSDKISNILLLSRLKQSVISDLVDIDITGAISEVVELIGKIPDGIDISYELEEKQSISGNYILVQKLFLYLLKNAIELSNSTVICKSRSSASMEGSLGVLIEIEVSGPDITDEHLENFFDPFHVEDLMLHTEGMNTTMAICSEIVALHQGNISVRRNNTTGICLSVWLPYSLGI